MLYRDDKGEIGISKDLHICMLMDFYGQLLTKKQSEALELYYNRDLSLLEISQNLGISRQGVRDFIKKGEDRLIEYEKALGLAARFEDVREKISSIKSLAAEIEESGDIKRRILELSDDILNDF